jgi:rhodanese-related sulfurtransferase
MSYVNRKLLRDALLILGLTLLLGTGANLVPSRHLAWWGQGQKPPEINVDFRFVDAFTADTLRTSLPHVVILDTREPDRFAAGHIPGARRISYGDLGKQLTPALLEELRRADSVLLCGDEDEGDVEQLLAQELRRRGVQTSNVVVGGFPAWQQGGLPVEGGQS